MIKKYFSTLGKWLTEVQIERGIQLFSPHYLLLYN